MSEFWIKVIIGLRNIAIVLLVINLIIGAFQILSISIGFGRYHDLLWLRIINVIIYLPYSIFREKIKNQ